MFWTLRKAATSQKIKAQFYTFWKCDDEMVNCLPPSRIHPYCVPPPTLTPAAQAPPPPPLGFTRDLLRKRNPDSLKQLAASFSVLSENALLKQTIVHVIASPTRPGDKLSFYLCIEWLVTASAHYDMPGLSQSFAYTDWFKPHEDSREQILFSGAYRNLRQRKVK